MDKAKNMDYSLVLKFFGTIKLSNGTQQFREWNIPSKPTEKIEFLIQRFSRISLLDSKNYIFSFSNQFLNNYASFTVAQMGLTNNSRIEILDKELQNINISEIQKKNSNISLNYKINIKFIKFNKYSAFNCQKELKGILKLCFLNEITSKIDESYLEQMHITKNIPEMIYYILKILRKDIIEFEHNNEIAKTIREIMEKENGCNIINFSNFVDEQINQNWLERIINLVPKNELNEIIDTNFRLGKYDKYTSFFESELNKALRQSVFEFSVVSLVVLDREDFDKFELEREKCPNRIDKILYHGTQIHPLTCILTGIFRRSETFGYQHGKGVYFTDSLDYCYFYGGKENTRYNYNRIPKIGDTFTAISSFVYYDKNGFLKVNDYKARIRPGKNEVNFAYTGSSSESLVNPDLKKFYGSEYVIWELDQICPFISIKFKREEFCVIWRDDNFSEQKVYNNEFDQKFKDFLKERIRYIKQAAKYNVYPCTTTNEALELVNRKKYNKIILISNVRPDLEGKKFVDAARKIIGNDVIVLFLAYNKLHLQWIKNYKNAIFSNNPKIYEEYFDSFSNEIKMKELISKLERHFNVKFNFDNNFLNFPLYKVEGRYSDLTF